MRIQPIRALLSTGVLLALLVSASGLASMPASAGEVQTRIVGGSPAPAPGQPGGWPYQAALLYSSDPDPGNAQFCGGTLIQPSWVITAAHCVDGAPSPAAIDVSIGINDLRNITASDRIPVSAITIHPGWNDTTKQDDYALLRLQRTSSNATSDVIAPSQEGSTLAGKPGEIAGWGATSFGGSGTYVLLDADVPFVSSPACSAAYPPPSPPTSGEYYDATTMICAGYPAGGVDTCQGDSGGPLMASVTGHRVLAGLTSWGNGCALAGYPGVYSRVLAVRTWIATTTGTKLLGLTLSGAGSGTVSSSPSGISCGSDCTQDYADGTSVTLSAAAASGSQFTGWSGAGCSGTGTCSVTMSQVRDVTATFAALPAPEPTPAPTPEPTPTPTPAPDNTFVLSGRSVSVSKASIRIFSKATVLGPGKIQQIGKARATNNKGRVHWCSTTVQLSAAGTWSLRCPYGPTARRELKRKSLRVELKTTFWPTSGLPQTTQQQQFTLKRRR